MKQYNFRNNSFIKKKIENSLVEAKIVFKTEEATWVPLNAPSVVPISLDSSFNQGIDGMIKMEGFISTIKTHAKEKVTLLMTEGAHLNALSLKHADPVKKNKQDCDTLLKHFKEVFAECEIAYWDECVNNHPDYGHLKKFIVALSQTDCIFQNFLQEDALSTYTLARKQEYPDKELYLQKTVADLIEQCVCVLLLDKQGYKWQFYPGKQFLSVEYVNQNSSLELVYVFLAIERKKVQLV